MKYDIPENRTRFKNLRKLIQREFQNSKNEYLMGLLETSNNSNKAVDGAVDQVKPALKIQTIVLVRDFGATSNP